MHTARSTLVSALSHYVILISVWEQQHQQVRTNLEPTVITNSRSQIAISDSSGQCEVQARAWRVWDLVGRRSSVRRIPSSIIHEHDHVLRVALKML